MGGSTRNGGGQCASVFSGPPRVPHHRRAVEIIPVMLPRQPRGDWLVLLVLLVLLSLLSLLSLLFMLCMLFKLLFLFLFLFFFFFFLSLSLFLFLF